MTTRLGWTTVRPGFGKLPDGAPVAPCKMDAPSSGIPVVFKRSTESDKVEPLSTVSVATAKVTGSAPAGP